MLLGKLSMKKWLFNSTVFVVVKLRRAVKPICFLIKFIGKILLHKKTHTILGSLSYIAALIVAGTAVLGYFYTVKPTFDKKMLENKIIALSEKEQNLTSENKKINYELSYKINELNVTNIKIADLNKKELELNNTNIELNKQIEALGDRLISLKEKEQDLATENQKISEELLKKENELNATNTRIAELSDEENRLKNANNELSKQIEVYEKNIKDLKNSELVAKKNLNDTKNLYMAATIEYLSSKRKQNIFLSFSSRMMDSDIFSIENINNIEQDLKKSIVLPIDKIKQEIDELNKYLDGAKSISEKENFQKIITTHTSNMKKYREILNVQEPDYKSWKNSFVKAIETKQKYIDMCKEDYERQLIKFNKWNNKEIEDMRNNGELVKIVDKHSNCEWRIALKIELFFNNKWRENFIILSEMEKNMLDLVSGKIGIKKFKSNKLLLPPLEKDIEKYFFDQFEIR